MADYDFLGYRTSDLRKAVAASTLQGAIRNFLQALELTDTQSALVANRQQLVRDRAISSALMDIEKTQLIGSYARSTQIRAKDGGPSIDVDCLLILETTDWNKKKYWDNNDGGTKVLEDLKSALDGYQGMTAVIERPAVTLTWKNMKMEMVPAFNRKNGGYLIPSANSWSSEWQSSDPVTDGERITAANKKSSGDFIPLAKMLKCWNRNNSKPLSSFGIETVLYHTTSASFQGMQFEMSWFFKKLLEYNGSKLSSPSGVGKEIDVHIDFYREGTVREAESKVKRAYELAGQGKHMQAIAEMAEVFGHPFQGSK